MADSDVCCLWTVSLSRALGGGGLSWSRSEGSLFSPWVSSLCGKVFLSDLGILAPETGNARAFALEIVGQWCRTDKLDGAQRISHWKRRIQTLPR